MPTERDRTSLGDRVLFGVVNALLYVRHPEFTLRFRRKCGRWPDYARPRSFEDLVQWRKLFDRNPTYSILLDKIAVKDWARERCPDLLVPETVWTGDVADALPTKYLDNGYVIKTSNSVNQNYFPVKSGVSREAFLATANRWISRPRRSWRFWFPVRRRFLAERLVIGAPLVDISIRVTDGTATIVSCATDFKTKQERLGYFFRDGTRIWSADSPDYESLPKDFVPPQCLPRAVSFAERIGAGWDYLRIDFLAAGDTFYLSEITLYPNSGYGFPSWRTEVIYRYWLEALHLSWPLNEAHGWPLSLYFAAFDRWLAKKKRSLGPAVSYYEQRYEAERVRVAAE